MVSSSNITTLPCKMTVVGQLVKRSCSGYVKGGHQLELDGEMYLLVTKLTFWRAKSQKFGTLCVNGDKNLSGMGKNPAATLICNTNPYLDTLCVECTRHCTLGFLSNLNP